MKGSIGNNRFSLSRRDRHSIDIVPFVSSGLTIPPFEDFVLSAGLFNLNPVGYSGGQAFENDNEDSPLFLTNSPYLPDYSVVTNFDVLDLFDQSTENNNFVDGTGNPSLILTSPTVVAGAGTTSVNQTLTYYGLVNGRYAASWTDGFNTVSVSWSGSSWDIVDGLGTGYNCFDDVLYPWEGTTWVAGFGANPPSPTVTQGTPDTAIISFDGVDDQLVTTANVFTGGSQQGTVYVYFRDSNSGGGNSFIFSTGEVSENSQVGLFIESGITGKVVDSTGESSSKTYALSDSNWHFVAFGFDTTLSPSANQTIMYVDGVAGGELGGADLMSALVGDDLGYAGIDQSATYYLSGSILGIAVKNVLDTPAQMEAMRLWVESIPK